MQSAFPFTQISKHIGRLNEWNTDIEIQNDTLHADYLVAYSGKNIKDYQNPQTESDSEKAFNDEWKSQKDWWKSFSNDPQFAEVNTSLQAASRQDALILSGMSHAYSNEDHIEVLLKRLSMSRLNKFANYNGRKGNIELYAKISLEYRKDDAEIAMSPHCSLLK